MDDQLKILILEDDPERHEAFRRNLMGSNLKISEDSKETISLLKQEKWDILFLDHDLGGQAYVPSGENTGYEVAKWISENGEYAPETIVIHSMNPTGSKNMKNCLGDFNACCYPLVWQKVKYDYENKKVIIGNLI